MPPDLLLIVCDTARSDAFRPWGGPHATPTMERLCREGIIYTQATSPAPWTLPSTASMLSGLLPTEHGISGDSFRWTEGRPSSPGGSVRGFKGPWLPELLRDRGYRTWGASCNIWISPWGGFDRGFDRFVHLHDRVRLSGGKVGGLITKARRMYGKVDRGGGEVAEQFGKLLDESGPAPLFAFANLMETHAPYDPPRPFYPYAFWRRRLTRGLTGGPKKMSRYLSFNLRVATPPPGYVHTIRELYFHCGQYEDRLLGRFIEAIEQRGRPTVVAIAADHGENLGEGGLFNHNSSLAQTLLHVPLVFWAHKVAIGSGRVDEPVSLLGLVETLTGLADGETRLPSADWSVASEYESTLRHTGIPDHLRALAEARDGEVPSLVYHPGLAVRRGSLKYVATGDGKEELYDLESDPNEERNLLPLKEGLVDEFRLSRDAWQERRSAETTLGDGDVAEGEIADHLRTLGYID